jgi:hypothetical protein
MKPKKQPNTGDFNFGQMLKTYIDRKRIAKSELARVIGVNDSQIIAYQKRTSLQLGLVLRLSHAMKHNFFLDIAAQLPATFSTDVPIDDAKDLRILELERQVEILLAQKEVLLERRG